MASEGEGGLLAVLANRYHLPLRGKLGWMTPRAGVKTTLASEMRLPGLPDPKRGPHFFWAESHWRSFSDWDAVKTATISCRSRTFAVTLNVIRQAFPPVLGIL